MILDKSCFAVILSAAMGLAAGSMAVAGEVKAPSLLILAGDEPTGSMEIEVAMNVSYEVTRSITITESVEAFPQSDLAAGAVPVPTPKPPLPAISKRQAAVAVQPAPAVKQRRSAASSERAKTVKVAAMVKERRVPAPMPVIIGAFR